MKEQDRQICKVGDFPGKMYISTNVIKSTMSAARHQKINDAHLARFNYESINKQPCQCN